MFFGEIHTQFPRCYQIANSSICLSDLFCFFWEEFQEIAVMQQAVSVCIVCVSVSVLNVFTLIYSSDLLSNSACCKSNPVCVSQLGILFYDEIAFDADAADFQTLGSAMGSCMALWISVRFISVIESHLTPLRIDPYIRWIFGYLRCNPVLIHT